MTAADCDLSSCACILLSFSSMLLLNNCIYLHELHNKILNLIKYHGKSLHGDISVGLAEVY